MSDSLCEIDIHRIDLSDERYNFSPLQDDVTSLAATIKDVGLVYPPIVKPVKNKFIIISGFLRIKALLFNQSKKITVLRVEDNSSELECLKRSVSAILFKRPLTQSELICSITRFSRYISAGEISDISSAVFNQTLKPAYIQKLIQIGDLPSPADKLIQSGHLSFKTADKLLYFEQTDIKLFLKIFQAIKISKNKQLEIIQFLKEIAARDNTNIQAIFDHLKLNSIVSDPKMESNSKTNRIRACLFQTRFPVLSQTRKEIRKKISRLELNKGIQFVIPENFENQNYNITFSAKSLSEFKSKVISLTDCLEQPIIKEVFDR